MKRLLLISCSATKRQGLALPAIERYNGPKFRVLRKALAEGIEPPTIRILSALYGLIGPEREIPNYNLELTPKSAGSMAWCIWGRGDILERVLEAEDVFVMAGGLYRKVLEQWVQHPPMPWKYAAGAPGERLQQLGQWLRQSSTKGE